MYRNYEDFDGHVLVAARQDTASGLAAFIAIHNENRGPAMGGCRILKYESHTDVDEANARQIADETGASITGIDEILTAEADIISPCALGGILSAESIPSLKAKTIVGGANNQLATSDDDARLRDAGILYCPDYLANAGGIIDLHYQRSNWTSEAVGRHVASLAVTFHEIIDRSGAMEVGTAQIADAIARERFQSRELV